MRSVSYQPTLADSAPCSLPELDPLYVPRPGYVEGLVQQLQASRCLCLVGHAGLGKSALAVDVGRTLWSAGGAPGE